MTGCGCGAGAGTADPRPAGHGAPASEDLFSGDAAESGSRCGHYCNDDETLADRSCCCCRPVPCTCGDDVDSGRPVEMGGAADGNAHIWYASDMSPYDARGSLPTPPIDLGPADLGWRDSGAVAALAPPQFGTGADAVPLQPASSKSAVSDETPRPSRETEDPPLPGCSFRAQCLSINGKCNCKDTDADPPIRCSCCCCCACPCECTAADPVVPASPSAPLTPSGTSPSGGHWETPAATGLTSAAASPVWASGPAGEIPADTRTPWGSTPQSQFVTEQKATSCPPGREFVANVGTLNGTPVSGCYPLPCPLPEGFKYARGLETERCGAAPPPGWIPSGPNSATQAVTPSGVGVQPIYPSGFGTPVRPPGFGGALVPTGAGASGDDGRPADFGKSKYPLAPPPKQDGVTWPGAPEYLYIDIPVDPCHPHDPPVPEAPVGYTHTGVSITRRIMVTCAPSVYPGLSANSVTFQYIDAQFRAQLPLPPVQAGQQVPGPGGTSSASDPPVAQAPPDVLVQGWSFQLAPKYLELPCVIAGLLKELRVNPVRCARPQWLDQSPNWVVPREAQEYLRTLTSGSGINIPSPDSTWMSLQSQWPMPPAGAARLAEAEGAMKYVLSGLSKIALGANLLPDEWRNAIRSGPWTAFYLALASYLANFGTSRIFNIKAVERDVPAIHYETSCITVCAVGLAAAQIRKLGPEVCFEMFAAMANADTYRTNSIWEKILGRFHLGFRAYVTPGVERERGAIIDQMELVIVGFDRFDLNPRAQIVEERVFGEVTWNHLFDMHLGGLAHAYNLLAANVTLYIRWPRNKPERAVVIGTGNPRDTSRSPWSDAEFRGMVSNGNPEMPWWDDWAIRDIVLE